jgi:hypothetical protein
VKRHWISTLIAILFLSMVITGVMGFFLPFNLLTVSVHALGGLVFTLAIGLHVKNNFRQLRGYFTRRSAAVILVLVLGLIGYILLQPKPVQTVLALSDNLGPDPTNFEVEGSRMLFRYDPASHYRMLLEIVGGSAFREQNPPSLAIWIENRSGYHIKTLHRGESEAAAELLPYSDFKYREYLKYKERYEAMSEAEKQEEIDAISSATENDSFDPQDYIVPRDPEREAPYRVLIEINQPGDGNDDYEDQPSLVYSVEVDNRDPRTFQVLEIIGYPRQEEEDGETTWALYFADETVTTARELLDSALLRIARGSENP